MKKGGGGGGGGVGGRKTTVSRVNPNKFFPSHFFHFRRERERERNRLSTAGRSLKNSLSFFSPSFRARLFAALFLSFASRDATLLSTQPKPWRRRTSAARCAPSPSRLSPSLAAATPNRAPSAPCACGPSWTTSAASSASSPGTASSLRGAPASSRPRRGRRRLTGSR